METERVQVYKAELIVNSPTLQPQASIPEEEALEGQKSEPKNSSLIPIIPVNSGHARLGAKSDKIFVHKGLGGKPEDQNFYLD